MLIRDFLKTRVIKLSGHPAFLRHQNQSTRKPVRTLFRALLKDPQRPPANGPGDPVGNSLETDRTPLE